MSMTKLDDAAQMLSDVGFGTHIKNSNMAVRFLVAATKIRPADDWQKATNDGIQIHAALEFLNQYYGTTFKENTRESLRKAGPKKMETVGLAANNLSSTVATNSKNMRWRLTTDFFELVQAYGTSNYSRLLKDFTAHHQSRVSLLEAQRNTAMIPINYNGFQFSLTPGRHNQLHKEVLTKFAPRFAGGSELLYIGDTSKKDLVFEEDKLQQLGFPMTMHDLIPDIVLYDQTRNWLFLIEAVASTGPMSIDRVKRIKKEFHGDAGLVFVSAFQNWDVYRRFVGDIAWETEIWIADFPDHMIHMNGDRFMGPRTD